MIKNIFWNMNNGVKMPVVGIGSYKATGEMIRLGLDTGYRQAMNRDRLISCSLRIGARSVTKRSPDDAGSTDCDMTPPRRQLPATTERLPGPDGRSGVHRSGIHTHRVMTFPGR